MVNNSDEQLDHIFIALSDPTRRAMLTRLVQGECSVSELPNPFGVSKAAISKHLAILTRANLIGRQKDGRTIRCKARVESLDQIVKLLEDLGQFWRTRLDSLAEFVEQTLNKEYEHNDERRTKSKASGKKNNSRRSRKSI